MKTFQTSRGLFIAAKFNTNGRASGYLLARARRGKHYQLSSGSFPFGLMGKAIETRELVPYLNCNPRGSAPALTAWREVCRLARNKILCRLETLGFASSEDPRLAFLTLSQVKKEHAYRHAKSIGWIDRNQLVGRIGLKGQVGETIAALWTKQGIVHSPLTVQWLVPPLRWSPEFTESVFKNALKSGWFLSPAFAKLVRKHKLGRAVTRFVAGRLKA